MIQAFLLGLFLHQTGAGNHHGTDMSGDLLAFGDDGRGAQILDAPIGAGADEDAVHLHLGERRAGFQIHVS